ncbi:MAG TPA: hypothetical protein VGP22_08225 [Albitalea sp.]|jgi:hypothetical protein|nr:hypothetical protein [Albitalea sp.]
MSQLASPPVQRADIHPDLPALRAVLARHAAFFHASSSDVDAVVDDALAGRMRLHRCDGAACIVVDDLRPSDLEHLRRLTSFVLITQPQAMPPAFGDEDFVGAMERAGFKIFFPRGTDTRLPLRSHSSIGSLEFLLSDHGRLSAYPVIGGGRLRREHGIQRDASARAVFVLDLIQDFEVLRPTLARAAGPFGPLRPTVAVTDRVLASHTWDGIKLFLDVLGIPWFKPLSPADVGAALGSQRSLLVTASETSAPGHVFSHTACRAAPPRAIRVTMQHGYECVGLRHHRAHDQQFPQGVRFASDVILTWRPVGELPDLHPADRDKCLAVGVTKAIAERAADLLEARWNALPTPDPTELKSNGALLLAENLHSVRFAAPQRYQRFIRFIEQAHELKGLPVVVRSHPGKRTLEKTKADRPFAFLEGPLVAEHFLASRGLVSPPSTIVLDAALCARPAAVWTDAVQLGDAENYRGLPTVTTIHDLGPAVLEQPERSGLAAFEWAVRNTSALNGNAAAWHHLCNLVN